MHTEVIIVAAGAGKRLKAKTPKALVLLKGRPLITHCLKVFNTHPCINGIVVVGVKAHLKAFVRIASVFKKVHAVVPGGRTRSQSVQNGLKALSAKADTVLVHDAARPFVDAAMVNRLAAALRRHPAAIVGVPVKFTVKKVAPKSLDIQETPARAGLWEAQTPQGFNRKVLAKAHARPSRREATDDAMMAEAMGIKVKMVMGDYRNIKITTREDLILARGLGERI